MVDSATPKKTTTKKKTAPKKVTKSEVVDFLKGVQRQKLSRDEFANVTAVIRLLSD